MDSLAPTRPAAAELEDLVIGNGSPSELQGNEVNYTATITAEASGTVTVDIGGRRGAGAPQPRPPADPGRSKPNDRLDQAPTAPGHGRDRPTQQPEPPPRAAAPRMQGPRLRRTHCPG